MKSVIQLLEVEARLHPQRELMGIEFVGPAGVEFTAEIGGVELFQLRDSALGANREIEALDLIFLSADIRGVQPQFREDIFGMGEIAAELDAQHGMRAFEVHALELLDDASNHRARGFMRIALVAKILGNVEPSKREDAQAENLGLGAREIDLLRGEEEARVEMGDGDAFTFRIGGIERKSETRVAQVDPIKKRAAPDGIGVIDAEHDAIDHREHAALILRVVELDLLADETAERIECEAVQRNFNALLAELIDQIVAPLLREAVVVRVPGDRGEKAEHDRQEGEEDSAHQPMMERLGLPFNLHRRLRPAGCRGAILAGCEASRGAELMAEGRLVVEAGLGGDRAQRIARLAQRPGRGFDARLREELARGKMQDGAHPPLELAQGHPRAARNSSMRSGSA